MNWLEQMKNALENWLDSAFLIVTTIFVIVMMLFSIVVVVAVVGSALYIAFQ